MTPTPRRAAKRKKPKTAYCLRHGKVTLPHPCGQDEKTPTFRGVPILRSPTLIPGREPVGLSKEFVPGILAEAQASCSLDGDTQSCDACILERTAGPHRCGRREITAAEARALDATIKHSQYEMNYNVMMDFVKAVRAERAAMGKR